MALDTNQYGYLIDPLVPITDDKGTTIKDGFLRVYIAGSSTPVITYRNFDGAVNEKTIELDNSGRTKTSVIGSKGLTYKVCVYDQLHSQESPILTVDKVSVIGANITAGAGATVVTGIDGFRTKPDGFVDASVIGTDGYVALDHTLVEDELVSDAKVTAVEDDRFIPLLNEDVDDPDSKMTLGRLWQWVLGKIKSLSTTITAFRAGDVIPVDGPDGTAKMTKDDLLAITAENANVEPDKKIARLNSEIGKQNLSFDFGALDVNGDEIPSTARLRSNFIAADDVLAIVATMENPYQVYVYAYDSNKDFIDRASGWANSLKISKYGNYADVVMPAYITSASFFRLVIRKSDNSSVSYDDIPTIFDFIDFVYWNDSGKDFERNRESIVAMSLFNKKAQTNYGKIHSIEVSKLSTTDVDFQFKFIAGHTYSLYVACDNYLYANQYGSLSSSFVKISSGNSGNLKETIYTNKRSDRFFVSQYVKFTASQNADWLNFYVNIVARFGDDDKGNGNIYFIINDDSSDVSETLQDSGVAYDVYDSLNKQQVKFYEGSINEYGADVDNPERIRTGKISLDEIFAIKLVLQNGTQAYVYAYDSDDNFLGRDGWYSDGDVISNIQSYHGILQPVSFVDASYFRIVFRNVNSIIDSFYGKNNIYLDITYINDACKDSVKKEIQFSKKSNSVALASAYPQCVYTFSIDNISDLNKNFGLAVKTGHRYKIGIFADDMLVAKQVGNPASSFVKLSTGESGDLKDEIFKNVKSDKFFISEILDFTATQDAPCFNLFVNNIIKIADGSRTNSKLKICIVDLDVDVPAYDSIQDVGSLTYEGEKIVLKQNRFFGNLMMNLQSSVESHSMQAIAEHNGTLFVGYDSGYCVTYDTVTREKVSQFDFGGKVASNHCGNLNFGKNYFVGNSDFPALYVSGDLTNLCCYVESVTKTSSELKQRINFSLTTYKKANGSQAVIDNERNKIVYMQRTLNDIYSLSNSLYCVEFDLPALTDGVLTDGVLVVTLTDADVTAAYELPEYKGVYQGAIINDGKLYQLHGHQSDGEGHYCGIMVFDIATNSMVSYVDITPIISAEPQGITMFKNGLLINWLTGEGPLYYFNF